MASLSELLKKGVNAHQRDELDVAQECYRQILIQYADEPNANQLLGLIYSKKNRLSEAIEHMERSLAIAPKQPNVLNNLANCYKKRGDLSLAISLYSKAIELDNQYVDAVKNIVSAYVDIGEFDQAYAWLTNPNHQVLPERTYQILLGRVCIGQKKYHDALFIFKQLLSVYTNDVQVKHNYALTLRLLGKSSEAVVHYAELVESGVCDASLFHNYANSLTDIGNVHEAILFYERALKKNPGYPETHKNLNNLYWELGDQDSFLKSFERVNETLSDSIELKLLYCDFLFKVGKFSKLNNVLNDYEPLLSEQAQYNDLKGRLYFKFGQIERAIKHQKKAVEVDSHNSDYLNNLAKSLIEVGAYEDAQRHLLNFLHENKEDQMALAHLGVCWRLQGKNAQEQRLNQYENFVRAYCLPVPEDYESIQQFCDDLSRYLRTQHATSNQPLEQTLNHGSQTQANLFDNQNPLIIKFIKQIEIVLSRYKTDCKFCEATELGLSYCKDTYFSGSWSVRLKTNGFHNNHVHQMGWISACFYVELPNVVDSSEDKSGWIKFGEPQLNLKKRLKPQKYVKPVVGTVVFFPSYMWHGTVPFHTDEERITIAFDIAKANSN